MSRIRSAGSYGHFLKQVSPDSFRIGWIVDRYYVGSRLRFPRYTSRETDSAGAKRFAKRWKISFPELGVSVRQDVRNVAADKTGH